jgi:2-dehydropantoate 2-reductase
MAVKFTVLGAGAIGATVGAYMLRAGESVTFVDTDREHVAAMQSRGLTIRGYAETFNQPVAAMLPADLTGPLDVVLLAVKAQHTEAAVRSILHLVGPETCIVSLQNGLCEQTISQFVGPERTVGAFVNFSADYIEPGLIHYGSTGALYVGELDGRITERVQAIAKALGHWGTVHVTANIWGYLWGKLGYANMLFATALADEKMGDVTDRYRELLVELACEIYEAADREGIRVESFDAIEPALYNPREKQDWEKIHASLDHMVKWQLSSQKTKSGIWRDLAVRKRRTEVDMQIGLAAAVGAKHGLSMDLTRRVIAMIHELVDGNRQMSWANLDTLEEIRRGSR